jgi:hypothetical protein
MKEYLDKNINYMESLDKANNLSINGKIELNLLKEVKKQLILTDVSQRSELLLFDEYIYSNESQHDRDRGAVVDRYLAKK